LKKNVVVGICYAVRKKQTIRSNAYPFYNTEKKFDNLGREARYRKGGENTLERVEPWYQSFFP
jgi:hypothetical protein